MLTEMRDEGGTDYLCVPVEFSDGHVNTVAVASDAPRGFSRRDLDRMFALLPLFARIVEVHAVRRLAADLLDVYVGHAPSSPRPRSRTAFRDAWNRSARTS